MRLTPDGEISTVRLRRAALTAGVVLTYEQAATALGDPTAPVHRTLAAASQLANMLLARRRARGALALYDLVRGWATTEEGMLHALDAVDRNAGYVIVQELMIAANEAMARYAAEREAALLFRNHVASPLAPPREGVQADLDLLAAGPSIDPNTIAARLHLLLRPATYACSIEGHYGLNLPVYTHATSPLRRYADLVNQRILSALIDHRPSPYTHDQLAEIASELNVLDRQQKERRAERNAEARRAETRQVMVRTETGAAYQGLDPDTFHKALKLAIAEARQTDGLLAEVQRRLAESVLAARDLHRLLFVASGPVWDEVRQQALIWLADHPEAAVSILEIERAMRQWEPLVFSDSRAGADHVPLFTARAQLMTDRGPVTGVKRTARSKKDARQQAVVSLLSALLGASDPSRDWLGVNDNGAEFKGAEVAIPVPRVGVGENGANNAIGALNEYAQKRRIAMSRYDFEHTGPAHAPTFTCKVTLTLGPTGAERTATATGTTKAEAKATAAARLWRDLDLTDG